LDNPKIDALKSAIREPLVLFLVLGAGIFVLFEFIGDSDEFQPDEIVVGAGQIERMSQAWRKTWMRVPTQPELEGLIEDYIQEEIYYREAVALGLDQDNAVIRRHLRQKMKFLSEDIAAQVDPDEEELDAFLSENPERFREDAQFSFRHIYFNLDARGTSTDADARQVLANLNGTETAADTMALGDPLPLSREFELIPERDIRNRFGRIFAQQLSILESGQWLGPVESGFGLHLVFVDERIDAYVPELDSIHNAVVREWREARRQQVNAAFYQGLRSRYSVVIERPAWLKVELNIADVLQR